MTHSDLLERPIVDPAPTIPKVETVRSWTGSGLIRRGIISLILVGLTGGGWSLYRSGFWRGADPILNLPTMTVSKVDLSTVVTAPGRVESSHNTIITCDLERLEIRAAGGRSMSSGGASTILSLVAEGSQVTKGEVICALDSSEYEDLVLTQEIKTEQATAAMKQAQLNLEVAEIAVREYRLGLSQQNLQSLEGTIRMAESGLERSVDRFQWTAKMLEKGYSPVAAKATAARNLAQFRFDLEISQLDLANFRQYRNQKSQMELDAEVEKRRFELIANTQRVTRNNEQLAYYKRMVDLCTIRAPHDGFLIYSSDPSRPGAAPIEPGMTVRQSQKLFYLPDLGNMEVMAYLHESVAAQVHEGMRAKARIEGLANRSLEGHVVSIAPLPTNGGNWFSDEVKYFVTVVKLDSVPNGIRPGMSAEVEFDIDRRLDVLAVSPEAIAIEQGRDVCYVAGANGLLRRPVVLGRSSRDFLEVTKGLSEGDHVILHPEKIEALDSLVVNPGREPEPENGFAPDVPSTGSAPISVE